VATVASPGMFRAWLFIVSEVAMEGGQAATHESRLGNWHSFILGSVQDIDARVRKIAKQLDRIAGQIAAQLKLFEFAGALNRRHAAAVGPKTSPGSARADGSEEIWIGNAEMPRAVSTHGMAG